MLEVADDADLARMAAVLINGVTAWMALHTLVRLRVADDVVVFGVSGGLGGTAAHLAALHPARRVISVVGTETKRRTAPTECTDVVVAADSARSVDGLTAGRGVDVVMEPVGGDLRAHAYEYLAPFGRLVVLGNASGEDRALSSDDAWHGTRQVGGLSLGAVAHLVAKDVAAALSAVVALVTVASFASRPRPWSPSTTQSRSMRRSKPARPSRRPSLRFETSRSSARVRSGSANGMTLSPREDTPLRQPHQLSQQPFRRRGYEIIPRWRGCPQRPDRLRVRPESLVKAVRGT